MTGSLPYGILCLLLIDDQRGLRVSLQITQQTIRVPSGRCPIPISLFWDLPSLPPDMVICAWFWEIREYGLRRGQFFKAEAIAYWAQEEKGMEDDYEYIEEVIMNYARGLGE